MKRSEDVDNWDRAIEDTKELVRDWDREIGYGVVDERIVQWFGALEDQLVRTELGLLVAEFRFGVETINDLQVEGRRLIEIVISILDRTKYLLGHPSRRRRRPPPTVRLRLFFKRLVARRRQGT
jgi:hypothetical protein